MIDLRSDTVTRPTLEMRKMMAEAEVGDDVFGEDPTVNQLQKQLAGLLGKPAALFVPSGTMANEISINCHTQPGDEVICEAGAHILNYESGAASMLSSVQLRPLKGTRGVLDPAEVTTAIHPDIYHFPRTALVSLENTHNSAGGTVYPLAALKEIYELTREHNLKLHLDGARLWNASVASGVELREYAACCDSVSVCFSKGLGAPIGSAVAGEADFIKRAVKVRKMFGGGMRQVGILAAAAIYAIKNNINRLQEDHDKARMLASCLTGIETVTIDESAVETNIVVFEVDHPVNSIAEVVRELALHGVLVVPFGGKRLRAVTHADVSFEQIDQATEIFRKMLRR